MRIRQVRQGQLIDVAGDLEPIATVRGEDYLTTTIFVKYNYEENADNAPANQLSSVSVLCLPNGLLQNQYNPSSENTIWLAGRNAPSRGEAFRVRISLPALKRRANWRVQNISVEPEAPLSWDD